MNRKEFIETIQEASPTDVFIDSFREGLGREVVLEAEIYRGPIRTPGKILFERYIYIGAKEFIEGEDNYCDITQKIEFDEETNSMTSLN